MSLFLRGVVWFGVYLGLILAPAGAALVFDPIEAPRPALREFSVALGLLAFALILIQFALVSRLRASSKPFGTDALVQFHQYMGFVSLGLVVAHPLALNWLGLAWTAWSPVGPGIAARSGAAATWALVALVGTTVLRRRLKMRYELWQALHLALSIVAAVGIVVHVLAVNGYTQAQPVRYVLLGYAAAFGVLALQYRVIRPLRLRTRPWVVVENRDESASTRTIRVRPAGHQGFAFEPGQFAWLITGRQPLWSQQHPFSISSSAELTADRALEFSVKALGDWSTQVAPTLVPGTTVWIDGPFGAFTTERAAGQGFVLIAGGIGIAPMRSMLLTMRDRGDRRHVVLVYAAHDSTRLIFRDELEALRGSIGLDIVYVFETLPEGGQGEQGFVTRELLSRRLPPHFRRYHYFVCGPPGMMEAVEAALTALGIPGRSIESERFNVM
jgi:predicted ferric reductase